MKPYTAAEVNADRCSIRWPVECFNLAVYGSWCDEHDPYRCGHCGEHATHIEPIFALDTDFDMYFCDKHWAEYEIAEGLNA